jgi:predicted dehydrogenase
MEAGKHVFCEKPCATAYPDYLRQIELERAHPGLITYVDYILYFDPMEQKLRRMVADGAFGDITQIQINYRHPINIVGEKAWKLRADAMGDAIGMGINHALSVMVFAMASQARPVRVYATSTPARVRGFEADPIWNVQVEFDNGAGGFCFGNIDSSNGYDAYHSLYGSRGAFLFDSLLDQPNKVRYWSEALTGGDWVYPLDAARDPDHAWPPDLATPDSGNVIEHQTSACMNHFIDAIKSGAPSPLSFANSALIAEIGWGALVSARLRQPVDLPLNSDTAIEALSG